MKIFEILKQNKGTYAGVRYDANSINKLNDFIKQNKIPNPINPNKIHTTVLYSRKYLPDYEAAGKLNPPINVFPEEIVVWKTNASGGLENNSPQTNCLVLKCNSPGLLERHQQLMNTYKATYDYPQYIPHITLSYDIGDFDVSSLSPDGIGNLSAVQEYQEELDLNWAQTKGTK